MRDFVIFFEDTISGSVLGYAYPGADFAFIQKHFPNLRFFLVKRENLESQQTLSVFLRFSEASLRKNPALFEALGVINAKVSHKSPVSHEYKIGQAVGRIFADAIVRKMEENARK